MDWLDLLAVQGTLKSLLEHHTSKASILWRSAFLTVQLSHPYMTTGKTIALTRRTLVGKVMYLAVQGTLKSLQHHSSKASVLQRSAFLTVQLSHSYMTTGKTIALTRWTLVGKVMSLLLNILSRLVITFLPRSSLVQLSCSVVSNSLRPHESKHARPPCPSPTPRVHSDSRPSSPWCHPAISSSVVPFSSCP